MLSYNEQYNITAGIYMAFTSKTSKRMLSVSHGQDKRDKMQPLFSNKFKDWTRDNYVIAVLYINFTKNPKSLSSSIEMINDLEKKEVMKFKDDIINHKVYIKNDIDRIILEEGTKVDIDYMNDAYRSNKIKWYTYYFYITFSGTDIDKLSRSRINGYLIKNIKKLLLYITFSEKTTIQIRRLIQDVNEYSIKI